MYSTMQDLIAKISTLVSTQTQSDDLMKNRDQRQDHLANQQQQLIEIFEKVSE